MSVYDDKEENAIRKNTLIARKIKCVSNCNDRGPSMTGENSTIEKGNEKGK